MELPSEDSDVWQLLQWVEDHYIQLFEIQDPALMAKLREKEIIKLKRNAWAITAEVTSADGEKYVRKLFSMYECRGVVLEVIHAKDCGPTA